MIGLDGRRAIVRDTLRCLGTGLFGAAIALTGCTALGPDFKTPDAPIAESWIEAAAPQVEEKPDDYRDWWGVFGDATLDRLVELAYGQNLTLQIAGLRVLEARAQLGIAVGNQYPQLQQISGQASMNQLSENAPNQGGTDAFFYNYQGGFDASWELDFWGRFRRGVESADAALLASIANYDDFLVTLTAEVARTYVSIRTFEERIALARQNVALQQRSLRIAQVRFRNGATTELDVTQARSLLRDTEATIPAFEIGLRQARNALAVLLGMPPEAVQRVLATSGSIPVAPPTVAVGIPADTLRRRPDVRQAELQAAAQSARIGIALTDLYPRISLLGSIGLQTSSHGGSRANGADAGDLFQNDSLTYFLGPSVQWPIFNYGRLRNNVRVQDARFQQTLINYQNAVLRAAQEVEDGLIAFLRSQDRVAFLSDSVAASERSVDLSLIQYRDGAADYQRVLDSQRNLVTAQDNWTVARGDIGLGLIATYKALGGGWQIRSGNDIVPAATQGVMRDRTDWGQLLPPGPVTEDPQPPAPARQRTLLPHVDW